MKTPGLQRCTLTGVDEQSDLTQIAELSQAHPIAEWGLLYSPKRQGQPGRYPSVAFLKQALQDLPPYVDVALHVCGAGVPQLLEGESVVTGLVELIAQRGGRVQLNFNAGTINGKFTLAQLRQFIDRYLNSCGRTVEFITQHNSANAEVWRHLTRMDNHAILFDTSGGRGLLPIGWPSPLNGVRCGYAGGLGPTNIAAELLSIQEAAGAEPYWIDMEGKLRNAEDWFDVQAAAAVLQACR